jgi:hypothetical protein
MTENRENGPVGDVPEDANKRKLSLFLSIWGLQVYVHIELTLLGFLISDCPGTEAEDAGKADACAGCPNQQICATAPKGPDPGLFSIPRLFLCV